MWMQLRNIVLILAGFILISQFGLFCKEQSVKEQKINLFDFCKGEFKNKPRLYLSDYPEYQLPDIKNYKPKDLEYFIRSAKSQKVPFVVCDDFDGNGKPDVSAILVKTDNKSKGILIVFHSLEENKYKTFILDDNLEFIYNLFIIAKHKGLTIQGWGDTAIPESIGSVTLKSDGIEIGEFGSWSVLYFYDGDKYNKLVSSD